MHRSPALSRGAEVMAVCLVAAAFALAQILIGGTRLLFCLPSFGLIAVAAFLTIPAWRRVKPEPDRLCLWSAAAFFGYILARAFFSPVPYLARSDIYPVLGGLLAYLLVACVFTSARTRMYFVLFLIVVGVLHTLVGAVQFRDGNQYMPISWLQRAGYGRRASGFYVCPNHLAGLLEVLGVFGLSLVCWSRWPVWAKLLIGYATGVCYTGLVLAASRGGYLSATASLFVFGLLSLVVLSRAGHGLFWKIGGVGIAAAIVISLGVVFAVQKSQFLSSRAQTVFERNNSRIDFWRAAIQQWKLAPVFGTGSNTYVFYGRQFRTASVQADPIRVHNDYLELLADYGLIGAAGFVSFLSLHLRRGLRTFTRLGPKRAAVAPRLLSNTLALNIGALGAVSAYVIHSIFDFNLHIPANVLLLALVFGILANDGVEKETERARADAWVWSRRLAIVALALVLLAQSIRLLPGEYFAEKARVAIRDYDPLGAIFFAQQGIVREAENPWLYYYLGRGRIFQGHQSGSQRARDSFYVAALGAFHSARDLAPQDETFVLELAFTCDLLGRFAEAEWFFFEALKLDPKSRLVREYYREHIEEWSQAGASPGS